MKRCISFGLFFAVMWRGFCQALKWIGGLFGYKDQSTYGKVVWRIFAGGAAACMFVLGSAALLAMYTGLSERYHRYTQGGGPDSYQFISRNIYYFNSSSGNGFVYNNMTRKKLIKHVQWIAKPVDDDSLICFSDGKKRGYFSKNNGKVVLEPKYDRVWIFSDGVAAVEEKGVLYFIDHVGKKVMDKTFVADMDMDGYRFIGGYCVMNNTSNKVGLIDKSGNWAVQPVYDNIHSSRHGYWTVKNDNRYGVLSDSLRMVIPCDKQQVEVLPNSGIEFTELDNIRKLCDYAGNVIIDFMFSNVEQLMYNTDEVDENTEEPKRAVARCKAYSTMYSQYYGLIDKNGIPVTKPLYTCIVAIDNDRYLCSIDCGGSVILDGTGKNVNE